MKKLLFTLLLISNLLITTFAKEVDWTQGIELNSTTLTAFINNNGGLPLTIHIWEETQMGGDPLIINEDITLRFSEGGKIVVGTNEKLEIRGLIEANPQQIFQVSDQSNDISEITLSKVKKFHPEWWGLLPNTNGGWGYYNTIRQMMLDIKSSGGGHLHFSSGTYFIRDLIIDFDNMKVTGEGSSTILKYDETLNATATTTRQGQIVGIRGPIIEGGLTGNWAWNTNDQIENIIFEDISIEYNHSNRTPPNVSDAFDHLMNGLVVLNAKNVVIENVTVNLNGANRAFYIGAMADEEKTENVTLKNCVSINSVSGAFITHGYPEAEITRDNKVLKDITIENCNFSLNRSLYDTTPSGYSSGIYLHGSEKTIEPYCYIGEVTLNNNHIENADFGIRLGVNVNSDDQHNHVLYIQNNMFHNFKICGIFGLFKSGYILNNTFDSNILESEGAYYENAAIHITKSSSYLGIDFLTIERNIFKNVSRSNDSIMHTIYIIPANSALINVNSNYFSYENGQIPTNDITLKIDWGSYQNKFGLLNYGKNKFPNRGATGYHLITGANANDFTVKDVGDNYHYGN